MKELNRLANKRRSGRDFGSDLLEELTASLPDYIHPNRIGLKFLYWWFSTKGCDKKTAREIIRSWVAAGLCDLRQYHGISIRKEILPGVGTV